MKKILVVLSFISNLSFGQTVVVEGGKQCQCFDYNKDFQKCYVVVPKHYIFKSKVDIQIIKYEYLCDVNTISVHSERNNFHQTQNGSVFKFDKVALDLKMFTMKMSSSDGHCSLIITYLKKIIRA